MTARKDTWTYRLAKFTTRHKAGVAIAVAAALVLVFRLPSQSRLVRIRLIVVLVVGLTYSILPGISIIGHIIGLVVGVAMALLLPISVTLPAEADATALSSR